MCGEALSAAARFCGSCGHALEGSAEPTESAELLGLKEDTPDTGRPEGVEEEIELFNDRPLILQTFLELLLTLLTLGLWGLVLWLRRMQARYRITSQRIELVDGMISVRRRTIELFRIQDFEIEEPLFLRLRGAGNLIVHSLDPGEPRETLVGLPNVHVVHEALRTAALQSRQTNRVRLLEGM